MSETHPTPEQLALFRKGRLGPAEAADLQGHLSACRSCRETSGGVGRDTHGPGAPAAPPREEGLPERIGPYRIEKLLGRGGMGSVFLAHDERLDRPTALKVPHLSPAEGPHVLERFYREARAAARLEHPNICPVYEVGDANGVPYLAMRYLEGRPLSEYVQEGEPLPQRQAAALVGKLALALQVAHEHGIIHRDLKPSNVMVLRGREPIVLDFGLARSVRRDEARLTRSGAVMGTPAYMSPEQAACDGDALGPATDVYSLGAILYELLTGRPPFDGPVGLVLAKIATLEPESPTKLRPDLDPRLEAVCKKAMAKAPADRYASMGDMATALLAYVRSGAAGDAGLSLAPGTVATPEGTPKRPTYSVSTPDPKPQGSEAMPAKAEAPERPKRRPKRRREQRSGSPWPLVAAAVLVVAAVAGGAVWYVSRKPAPVSNPPLPVAQVAPVPSAPAPPAPAKAPAAPRAAATLPPAAEDPAAEEGPRPPAPTDKTEDTPPVPAAPGPMPPAAQKPRTPAPARRLSAEEERWRDQFRVRVARFGAATCSHSGYGKKALCGVLLDLEPLGGEREVPLNERSVRGLDAQGKDVPAEVLFFQGNKPESLRLGAGAAATVAACEIVVAGSRFKFQGGFAGALTDLVALPTFLREGNSAEYTFRNARTANVGFLFEGAPQALRAVVVLGHVLPLDSDAAPPPPVAAAEPMPEPAPAAPVAPAAPAATVYHHVPKVPINTTSKDIQVIQKTKDNWDVTPIGNSGSLATDGTRVFPDALGSTNIRVVVNRSLGYTTLAGLRFHQDARLNIGPDGVVEVDKVGIRATDDANGRTKYVSRRTTVNGRPMVVMVEDVPRPAAPPPAKVEMTEEERNERAAAGKVRAAREQRTEGKAERARELLEEVVNKYPKTKAAEEARKLLGE